MNARLLLEHYAQIADAPDAIARLRRFILDLAVRGKLVEQDPNDEPATELLKRIAAEKAQLMKAGSIRKPRAISDQPEPPYTLPNGWCWSQIAEVGIINPRVDADDNALASFVPMPLIAAEYGVPNGHEPRPWGQIKKGYTHFAEGDAGLAKITPCFENGKSTVFRNLTGGVGSGTTELHVVRPLLVDAAYIVLFWKSPFFIESGIPKMTGTAGQKRVPTDYFANSPLPLPPLAEQHRIIAKVDELMALCDQLETAQAERETGRDKLTLSTLAKLHNSDPETFADDASFALEHLEPLTKRADQIKQLRQTILSLAVRGKLVAQDPNEDRSNHAFLRGDEAAEAYDLSAFAVQKAQFELPGGWIIEPLSRVSERIVDCPHTTPKWTDRGILCIRTNQVRAGKLDLTSPRYVSEETYKARIERLEPECDDILYIREGGVLGVGCRIPPGTRLCLGQRLMLIRANRTVDPKFLELAINSPWITDYAAKMTTGGAAPRVNMSIVRAYPIPVPPLAEQHRIIANVEKLMALCDQLEASLIEGEQTRSKLLNAVLHETLEPA